MYVGGRRPSTKGGGGCMYVGSWKKATCEGTIGMLKKNLTLGPRGRVHAHPASRQGSIQHTKAARICGRDDMPFDLSLAECVRVNDDLEKAMKAKESPALIDIMTEIKASNTKNKLKVRVRGAAAAERGPTIFPPLWHLFPLLFFRSRLTAHMNKHTHVACAVCGRFQPRSDHCEAHQVSV